MIRILQITVVLIGLGSFAMAQVGIERHNLPDVKIQKFVLFNDNSGLNWTDKENLIRTTGGTPLMRIELINAVVASFPQGIKGSLSSNPEVDQIVNDDTAHLLAFEEENPPAEEPASQKRQWGIDRVKAPQAWNKTKGEGAKVCVVDSGGELTHPDIAANIYGGKNFSGEGDETNYNDELGHGTHVSGIIAAIDNNEGTIGVAPKAQLYEARVFGKSGSTSYSIVIAGIDWCAANDMDVINMSLGGPKNTALGIAVKKAHAKGVIIVAAAGNDYGRAVGYPAAYPEVIAVSASDINDKIAYFSSKGPEVDLIAPGHQILAPYIGGGYDSLSGTSMACPHVAGVAALYVSANPNASNKEVKKALEANARNIGLPKNEQGKGMADIAKALGIYAVKAMEKTFKNFSNMKTPAYNQVQETFENLQKIFN
ncbi:S8 family peptidase [Elusimicrobiota bacterium]